MKNCAVPLLNQPVDVSRDFATLESPLFFGTRIAEFDPAAASGKLVYARKGHKIRMAFNQEGLHYADSEPWEFPPEYVGKEELLPFSISFVGPRTLRLRFASHPHARPSPPSLMLAGEPANRAPWKTTTEPGAVRYDGEAGAVRVGFDPWRIELFDQAGKLLTRTQHPSDTRSLRNSDPTPFCFVRAAPDYSRRFCATFALAPGEKIFGCGESFTRLDKRGQKVVLWVYDAHGAQTAGMYKPIPFFMSSRNYGMFLHTGAPAVFDFGHSYDGATTIFSGDETLDLFVFLGDPKQILSEYTALTGKSPVPPLWSFGLWMSRCTYKSESEAREVASELRRRRIPSDVIHLDTGWFEDDWRCDYRFSTSRFDDPARMIRDLDAQGFKISLWQLPYFTPKNRLFRQIVENGYAVKDGRGGLPTEDAILDFSNPAAVAWYQQNLAGLLAMGVGAIKADFGEAAPLHGIYASGSTGFVEHNLYPLRYNQAVAGVTFATTGGSIIWARSAWAGSQRYPLHWGGDPEDTDSGLAATLRAGLSLGLSGFSFWSHDIGGFVHPPTEDLYRRWLPFGMLTSHSRCHGVPPREPWAYSEAFVDDFRRAVELKYRLMPYVWAQAHDSSRRGFPMLRTLFFEYPDDPTAWLIEDEYLFGSDLLVAPLLEPGSSARAVYLPPGGWIDYQTGRLYEGARWHTIGVGPIAAVILARAGALIPHAPVAQSTSSIDWARIELLVFSREPTGQEIARAAEEQQGPEATGLVCVPPNGPLVSVSARRSARGWELDPVPEAASGAWPVRPFRPDPRYAL